MLQKRFLLWVPPTAEVVLHRQVRASLHLQLSPRHQSRLLSPRHPLRLLEELFQLGNNAVVRDTLVPPRVSAATSALTTMTITANARRTERNFGVVE